MSNNYLNAISSKELSKIFNCDVSISKGEKSSQKTIVCYDVSIEYILDKLGEIL